MGLPVISGKGLGWLRGVVPPAISPFPPPPYPAVGTVYPPPTAYPGVPSPASVRQHPQAGVAAWGAQGGKGEEHTRAWERIGEEERRLGGRDARIKEGAARVVERWTAGQGTPRGGETQAVEELQRARADLQRRLKRVERPQREGKQPREQAQDSGGLEGRPPLQPFRQPAIQPELGREMQERAWRQIRGEAARLAEEDREVAAGERRVREEERAMARGAYRFIPDPERGTSPADVEEQSPSGIRARGEGKEARQAGGKRRRTEERGAAESAGARRPASPSREPTRTDRSSELPPPRQYAPRPVRREPGIVWEWRAGDVAELVCYVKWVGRTRGGRERSGIRPFSTLVSRAGRSQEKGPEMEGGRWRRMQGEAPPGLSLDCRREREKKPRMRMLRELLQRKGWYEGEA